MVAPAMDAATARRAMVSARTALVLDQPFFGALSLRLHLKADEGCGTAWTDGTSLGFDPAFVAKLTHAERVALVAHEVMHCAAGHPWRRDARAHKRFNQAADYAINPVLQDAGFTLPAGGLIDAQYHGKSAEWIYDRLPDSGDDSGGDGVPGDGDGGDGIPNPLGEVRDAPKDDPTGKDPAPASEEDWKRATQQARNIGTLGGSLKRFAKDAVAPHVDWKAHTVRFAQETTSADYTWNFPNKRYTASGLYLPSLRSEECRPFVIAIDTSGSIDPVTLSQFGAVTQNVMDTVQPRCIYVIYCDTSVDRVDTFERGDIVKLETCGGGGTDFRPVFDAVADLDSDIGGLIYLTDLAGSFPDSAPDYPVLWASTSRDVAPFGETVFIGE